MLYFKLTFKLNVLYFIYIYRLNSRYILTWLIYLLLLLDPTPQKTAKFIYHSQIWKTWVYLERASFFVCLCYFLSVFRERKFQKLALLNFFSCFAVEFISIWSETFEAKLNFLFWNCSKEIKNFLLLILRK